MIQVAPVDVVSLCDVDRRMVDAAADLVATRQASKKRPRTYGDYREMLRARDLDIVLIDTPDHWHALPMIEAVRSGLDVWVQKPISVDVVEGQAMLAAARTTSASSRSGCSGAARRTWSARGIDPSRRSARHHRPGRDLPLLPDARPRESSDLRRPSISITRCGPARRPCGLQHAGPSAELARVHGIRQRHRRRHVRAHAGHGAVDDGPRHAAPHQLVGRSSSTRRARPTSPTRRRRRSTTAISRSSGRIVPMGIRRIRSIRGARRSTATRARSRRAS